MIGTRMEVLHWLLGCAIKFDYGEAPEKYNNPGNRLSSSSVTEQPALMTSNPLDKLDFSSREFRAGVDGLADKLQVMTSSGSTSATRTSTRRPRSCGCCTSRSCGVC